MFHNKVMRETPVPKTVNLIGPDFASSSQGMSSLAISCQEFVAGSINHNQGGKKSQETEGSSLEGLYARLIL